MNPTCRPIGEGNYLLPSHLAGCTDHACPGCEPCEPRDEQGNPLVHCQARVRCNDHVAPGVQTCPRCLGKAREYLVKLEESVVLAWLEATSAAGVNSEAANLAGPASDPIHTLWRRVNSLRSGQDPDDEDPHHPLAVMGRWELMLREHYDQDYSELPKQSISGSKKYLDAILDRFAQDRSQDFPLFFRELAAATAHVESVLHDSHAPERGAPCPSCGKGELVKQHRNIDRHGKEDLSGASDIWLCRTCKQEWSEADYRLRVGSTYLEHAPALTASQMYDQWGIKQGSLRAWASLGKVATRGRDQNGLTLYDVDGARQMSEGQAVS
jgi:hypothetical protein